MGEKDLLNHRSDKGYIIVTRRSCPKSVYIVEYDKEEFVNDFGANIANLFVFDKGWIKTCPTPLDALKQLKKDHSLNRYDRFFIHLLLQFGGFELSRDEVINILKEESSNETV